MDDSQPAPTITDLVDGHYAFVYRYAYRLSGSAGDAEDLTQQTFLHAQRKIGQLRDPKLARRWLYAIVRNNYLKSRGNAAGHGTISLERLGEPAVEPPEDIMVDEEELQQALGELPEEFRTPLILYYFEEFTYREIAEQLEVPIGTVMSRLARGKEHLRRRLSACQPLTAER